MPRRHPPKQIQFNRWGHDPKVEAQVIATKATESWWLNPETFYQRAKEEALRIQTGSTTVYRYGDGE